MSLFNTLIKSCSYILLPKIKLYFFILKGLLKVFCPFPTAIFSFFALTKYLHVNNGILDHF